MLNKQINNEFGFVYLQRPTGMPVLLSVSDATYLHAGLNNRLMSPFWILDYSFTPGGLYKTKHEAQRWLERPALVAHLYPPNFPFWEDTRPVGRRIHAVCLIFTGGEFAGLNRITENPRGFARFLDPHQILGQQMRETAQIAGRLAETGFWRAHSAFYATIDLLLLAEQIGAETRQIGASAPKHGESSLVVEVRRYLEQHLAEAVSLNDIARHLSISASSLSHRYKTAAGETPMSTRSRLAIDLAKSMLLKGYSLKQIAQQTGFGDIYHLSKRFKCMVGLSPRAYRRQTAR